MTPQTSALHHHLMHTMQNEKEPGNIENLVKLIKMRRETKDFNTTSEQDLKRFCCINRLDGAGIKSLSISSDKSRGYIYDNRLY